MLPELTHPKTLTWRKVLGIYSVNQEFSYQRTLFWELFSLRCRWVFYLTHCPHGLTGLLWAMLTWLVISIDGRVAVYCFLYFGMPIYLKKIKTKLWGKTLFVFYMEYIVRNKTHLWKSGYLSLKKELIGPVMGITWNMGKELCTVNMIVQLFRSDLQLMAPGIITYATWRSSMCLGTVLFTYITDADISVVLADIGNITSTRQGAKELLKK